MTAPLLAKPLLQTPPPDYVPGAWYDQEAVDRVARFFRMLRHQKGRRWVGKRFELLDFQLEYLIGPVFGWKDPDGLRIVRTAWWELPRKNGKSGLSSGLGLYLVSADREPGAVVVAAAGAKDQARFVFDPSRDMAMASAGLRRRCRPYQSSLFFPRTKSTYKVLSSDARLKFGLDLHAGIIDEVHVHKSRDLIDTLETSTAARDQPLIVFITTADEGEDHTIYAEKREYAEMVAAGIVQDPTFYAVVFAADEKDDPFDEQTWEKANPGIDVTVKREYLRKEARKAQAVPGYLPTFLRLHLGRRMRETVRWLPMAKWDGAPARRSLKDLKGKRCYGGLDLSSTVDLTAFQLIFPDDNDEFYDLLTFLFMPEETVRLQTQTSKVPYERWVAEGHIQATEGDVVDYAAVRAVVEQCKKDYKVVDVAVDPWQSEETTQLLNKAGVKTIPMRQGYGSLSAPSKEFERLVVSQKIRHGDHPVLRWMADIVEIKQDPAGNIKPVKPDRRKSAKRIDGIVASVMALDRAIRGRPKRRHRAAGF